MITKKMFCDAIEALQLEYQNNSDLADLLYKHVTDGRVVVRTSPTFEALLDLLENYFSDKEFQMIQWWLFDKVDKFIYDDHGNVTHDLTEKEALYDYLIENMICD